MKVLGLIRFGLRLVGSFNMVGINIYNGKIDDKSYSYKASPNAV